MSNKIWVKVLQGEAKEAILNEDGVLRMKGCICLPYMGNFISTMLVEDHSLKYSIYPSETKMYKNLRQYY